MGSTVACPPCPTQCLVIWHPPWGARGKPGLSPARRSIKRYFLMDQGDFFVHFMDLTEEELKKPVDDITPTRLEALLELALRMSTANTDPFKDDLKVGLGEHCSLRGRAQERPGPVRDTSRAVGAQPLCGSLRCLHPRWAGTLAFVFCSVWPHAWS